MAVYRSWAQSGVTQRANSTAYSLGAKMQPATGDGSTNSEVAKFYVWECTTAGTSGGLPIWLASYTPDSSTITDGTVVWTCRNPGYSSGSTVDWTFASIFVSYLKNKLVAGDTVLIHYTSQEASQSATYVATMAPTVGNCLYVSVDKDNSEIYTPMGESGYLVNSTITSSVSFNMVALSARLEGLTLRSNGSGTTAGIQLNCGDDGQIYGKDIRLELSNTNTSVTIALGGIGDARSDTFISNLTISRASTSQIVRLAGFGEVIGLNFAGSAVTTLFSTSPTNDVMGAFWKFTGMNASTVVSSSAVLVNDSGVLPAKIEFIDSILPSSYSMLSGASNLNESGLEVHITNCKAGATSAIHAYANALGSMIRNTTIVYNSESFSWLITASGAVSRHLPFRTPWYWGKLPTGSSITPRFEILRDDSTTALTDIEVFCEGAAAVTGGSPVKSFYSSSPVYTSAGSNIPAGAGLGSWTGESGTAWSGKLDFGAITPVGDEVMLRVCVATTTPVYVSQGWVT